MGVPLWKKLLPAAAGILALWLGVRFVLPVLLPFLAGAGLAFAAEPAVGWAVKRWRLPRSLAAGIGVTATLVGVIALVSLVGAVAVRELGTLTGALPQLADTAQQGMVIVQDWLVSMAEQAPEGVRPALQRTALELFDDGTVLLQQMTQKLPAVLGSTVSKVGNGVLGLGTGILAAYLISGRLPKLKAYFHTRMPPSWYSRYLPALRRVRTCLGGWLKAQLKLSGLTWCVVTVGFLLLRIPYGPLWAVLVALVDAVPILGTGTVLVPWALVCLLQGQTLQAVGLLGIYGIALTLRTVLEPRLVGRQLGLDPLATLLALYAGYRFWGILGMLLAPIAASAAKSLTTEV